MIRIRQIKIPIEKDNKEYIIKEISKRLKIDKNKINNYEINKKSLDCRYKPSLYYIYEIDINIENEESLIKKTKDKDILQIDTKEYKYNITGTSKLKNRPIIIGAGPSGLMCAYMLAKEGYKPLIIEQGEKIEEREKTVNEFWDKGILKENSNVQFGEGGAGTFSDGKLMTQVKDKYNRSSKVLQIFVECGAPEEIKYLNKPHIGTDILKKVIINLRNKIIECGGEFQYNTKLTNIITKDNKIKKIEVNNNKEIDCEVLILCIGNGARSTFKMLYNNNVILESKPFAVGVRVQHPQSLININQYGKEYENLGSASYKLTHQCTNKRGVYSFCMCPGGYVINASSEHNRLCINGMSYHKRDSKNANSAIVVTVSPKDFGNNPIDGINYQIDLEEKAYKIGKGNIPLQLYKDFKDNIESTKLGSVEPIIKGNYTLSNLRKIFPDYINESVIEAIDLFNNIINGFSNDDVLLMGVESRTSSPVRITRNENLESNIKGIYPIGEGAGYAGGITSASIDGIKAFEEIIKIYRS